ncbi:branched-subunit amino acid transport protein AzlD [Streptosporangium becharense]|uniref:Branched-subunit amino acid transport protein AzlD n=1 Tax=Streptosporangium becharense TaxID=1816182 RepID=A0A7W9IMW6_9ACTN|nr:AzlD domain-containing protein [Streptosporangium becharense]MBB2914300.1 branched-subunit amino acid transport protein AzlD [Streptosporangium becharense]MBB5823668.1 branched-subunit amino acid transport protein AzlD [Streptosporangium becharense]
MPSPLYLAAAVAVSAAVTWGLRALPFAVVTPLRRSAVLQYLAVQMPVGIMLILALYTLRDVRPTDWPAVVPTALALAAAIGLHLRTRNAVISVLGATTLHVVLSTFWPH